MNAQARNPASEEEIQLGKFKLGYLFAAHMLRQGEAGREALFDCLAENRADGTFDAFDQGAEACLIDYQTRLHHGYSRPF